MNSRYYRFVEYINDQKGNIEQLDRGPVPLPIVHRSLGEMDLPPQMINKEKQDESLCIKRNISTLLRQRVRELHNVSDVAEHTQRNCLFEIYVTFEKNSSLHELRIV